jgi:hypothetical protein
MEPIPALIEGVFTKLLLIYGTAKIESMYKGQPIEAVKRHWAHELRGLTMGQYEWAMKHLPADAPPNVLQFRALAVRRPEAPPPALEGPPADPERVRAAIAKLRELGQMLRDENRTGKAWARKLQADEASGKVLTQFQKQCWREALGREPGSPAREE